MAVSEGDSFPERVIYCYTGIFQPYNYFHQGNNFNLDRFALLTSLVSKYVSFINMPLNS